MMIHRRVRERLQTLAPYLTWDNDPYIVVTPEGRLVWMVDGYTTSDAHPFSREIDAYGGINYMRNSVKATIDAYDGETHHLCLRSRRSGDRVVPGAVSRAL